MKKELLITSGIVILLIIMVSVLQFTADKAGILKEDLDWYDSKVELAGIDPNLLLPSQKQPIAENEHTYIKDFLTTDYVNPGTNQFSFSRDWSIQGLVNNKVESDTDPTVHLFSFQNSYYIIATFSTDYSYNTLPQDIGFIDIGYSNNFSISCYYSISYISNSEEYILQNGILPLSDASTVPIKQNIHPIGLVFLPELIYTFTFQVYPTEDNDLDKDMFLSLDLDFYTKINHFVEKVQVGFNDFIATKSYNTYSVIRKSVIYEGGQ
jgi:hypothetical protein